jgi:hypothetical protein
MLVETQILGEFAELGKAIITFVACPSVRMDKLGSHCMDFHEIRYSSIFPTSVEKIQV